MPSARGPVHRPAWGPETLVVVLAVTVAVVAWLPFLHAPLTSDESGFLLLGEHLGHGSSLYGDYWVDRPPLLLWLFGLAGILTHGSATATGLVAPGVKLLGAVAAGLSVLSAWALAVAATPASRLSRRATPALMAVLLTSPLLGMPETDGEILALPFVLGGLACLITALRHPGPRRTSILAVAAGASGTGAALIKQNVVDVFVFALTAVIVLSARGRSPRWRQVGVFGTGAVGVLGCAVGVAAAQGTSPAALWSAVVTFRLHASAVIGASATGTTTQRLSHLIGAFTMSGLAPLLLIGLVALAVRRWRAGLAPAHRSPHAAAEGDLGLAWPVVAMVAWELFGVLAGGSYWLHYLTGLLPGVLLVVCLVAARPGTQRVIAAAMAAAVLYASLASVVSWARHVSLGPSASAAADAPVITYLRDHAAPGDGVVVAFGHPDIVAGSGLSSPYAELWSLPVRVNDPDLSALRQTLNGTQAPRWIVVAGSSLASWGLDATSAQTYMQRHYREQTSYGDWHIWERMGSNRDARARLSRH